VDIFYYALSPTVGGHVPHRPRVSPLGSNATVLCGQLLSTSVPSALNRRRQHIKLTLNIRPHASRRAASPGRDWYHTIAIIDLLVLSVSVLVIVSVCMWSYSGSVRHLAIVIIIKLSIEQLMPTAATTEAHMWLICPTFPFLRWVLVIHQCDSKYMVLIRVSVRPLSVRQHFA